jgi:chromate reductase, NAD(P)H dehydrogenase (quinone)
MSSGELQVLAIAGSLRRGSFNKGLIRAAQEVKPAGMNIEVYDLAPIPLYNEDLRIEGDPQVIRDFKERIAAADGLLLAVPEYNYSIAGVFKNAIDWASRPPDTSPLRGKPVAVMGAGGRLGAARAQYHLRQVAVFTKMFVMIGPELMVPAAYEKFDQDGNLTDRSYLPRIAELVASFASWIRFVQAGRAAVEVES